MGRLVVGLDGSEYARRALRWAAAEARTHRHELHVVSAFDPPDLVGLLEAAQGADLLVVGSRGRGGFRGLLLGSVSL